ncbi:MAG: methyltransferase [Thermoplasmatales archaeon]|nr:methyltransferase [Thermoplasmatales archaeon]
MEISDEIKIEFMEGVYKPEEDSYLLLRSIEISGRKALDMGCGCGIIALHLAKNGCDVVAVDINEKAVENTIRNAKINGINLRCFKSDLFEDINEKFDMITFNPPYLPTKKEDVAWDGGKDGKEIIEKFLKEAKNYLNKGGVIYMVMSSFNKIEKIIGKFREYEFEKISEKRFFFEAIYVYKIKLKS